MQPAPATTPRPPRALLPAATAVMTSWPPHVPIPTATTPWLPHIAMPVACLPATFLPASQPSLSSDLSPGASHFCLGSDPSTADSVPVSEWTGILPPHAPVSASTGTRPPHIPVSSATGPWPPSTPALPLDSSSRPSTRIASCGPWCLTSRSTSRLARPDASNRWPGGPPDRLSLGALGGVTLYLSPTTAVFHFVASCQCVVFNASLIHHH
ncbi:uncharacterized protein LOC133491126 [Syngnathoides biaculeatus]|uniref:uncharacterized protein LOC133491126 n=1 Tax=Syngnathoides biaculeatus TaxID=300417 RepID=UPI002ADD3A3F|nr:uncharacterized protein LOC133491126 [Syngnathoides biaculeatus]